MLKSYYKENAVEIACDEAGRGCLAGPVVAAAVIFPKNYQNKDINDSKKLSALKRQKLTEIIKNDAIEFAVGIVDNNIIDKINILNASILAMHKALDNINSKFNHIIIDGNKFKSYKNINYECIIKGDELYLSIAAASILAKTFRDNLMNEYHNEFPYYQWNKNKGYPTKLHKQMLQLHGITKYHRKTFKLIDRQLKFNFKE